MLGYGRALDAPRVEDHPVRFDHLDAHVPDYALDHLNIALESGKHVDVLGGARERRVPGKEHEPAFQHEARPVLRAANAEEKALHGEVLQELVEGPLALTGEREQPVMHRGREVSRPALGQERASR